MGALEKALRLQSRGLSLLERLSPSARGAARHLSADAQDLLSRMLEVDESARISLADVPAHPWCRRPLEETSPRLAEKLARLRETQRSLETEGAGKPRYLARDGDALINAVIDRAIAVRAVLPRMMVAAACTPRARAPLCAHDTGEAEWPPGPFPLASKTDRQRPAEARGRGPARDPRAVVSYVAGEHQAASAAGHLHGKASCC